MATYKKHRNFIPGNPLMASDLAEMDTQIKANSDALDVMNNTSFQVLDEVESELRTIRLSIDNNDFSLKWGDESIGYVSRPNSEFRVSCTGVSATVDRQTLYVGETAKITAHKTPDYSTDTIIFSSSNRDAVVVDDEGNVTALERGTSTVTVSCGSFRQEILFTVEEIISLEGHTTNDIGWLMFWTDVSNRHYIQFNLGGVGDNDFISTMPYDFDVYKVANNEKVKLKILQEGPVLRTIHVFRALRGKSMYIEDDSLNLRYYIRNVDLLDYTHGQTLEWSYTNSTGGDVWIAFSVQFYNESPSQKIDDIVRMTLVR